VNAIDHQVDFEKQALQFMANHDIKCPRPLKLSLNDKFDGWHGFIYPMLEGKCLSFDALTADIVARAGTQLSLMIAAGEQYSPCGNEPDGDLEFIERIFSQFQKNCPKCNNHPVIEQMLRHVRDKSLHEILSRTPKGLAHADYFFENVLVKGNEIVGVIDFGDAYYGHLLMDIATGAMEFFRIFIQPLSPWLLRNNIDFALFRQILLANCVRFAAHTLNLAVNKGKVSDIESNPYIQRFKQLNAVVFVHPLEKAFRLEVQVSR
jgi:aminoglycoside phosphotransferase (APT) family kinase protein